MDGHEEKDFRMIVHVRYQTEGREIRSTDPDTDDYLLTVEQTHGRLEHAVDHASRTRITIRAKKELTLITSSIKVPYTYQKGDQVFINGYQSWTDSREYDLNEAIHNMNRVPRAIRERFHFDSYGDTWFLQYQKDNYHSFTFTYIRHTDGQADFIGSRNDQNAYLIVHHKKREDEMSVRTDCEYRTLKAGDEFCLYDFVRYRGPVQEVLHRYFEQFGHCEAPPVRGYTSWYLHYQDINEQKMQTALEAIHADQFDLFQIDDGYETFVGDWMDIDPVKFPNGLTPMVEKIHAKGLKAGIWMAPFVCEVKSRLYREHPEWIYRENGIEVFAGSNWSGDVVLDLRRREVQDYIRECLMYYVNLGFDFFKLDFLYAAAMIHEGRGYTRAEIMRSSMQGLREILAGKQILGCGVPLSSAFNLVDYCRIGPDVSLKFDDVLYMRAMHRERISTKTTLQNTIYRSCMDGYVFRCDPDVFLLRDDHIGLNREQRRALICLNHLCGAVYMTSDNVGQYDADKLAILEEARKLSDAEVIGIHKDKDMIRISYRLQGREESLTYNRKLGVLV